MPKVKQKQKTKKSAAAGAVVAVSPFLIQNYEIMLILKEDSKEAAEGAFAKKFSDLLKLVDGSVEKEDFWGVRSFAYKIKKLDKGVYIVIHFRANRQKLKQIEEKLKLLPEVVRFLITKK